MLFLSLFGNGALSLCTCSADLFTKFGGAELEGMGACIVFDDVELDYQLVFPTLMYESYYTDLDLEPH